MSDLEAGAFVDAGGFKTHYHEAGDGPPLLLLHGSGPGVSSWANWGSNLPVLAEHFRVIALDMLGFGDSEAPSDVRWGHKTWTDHAVAFLDALELDRVGVVGNSLGGIVSIQLAARHPERISRMALMGSGFFPPDQPRTPSKALQAVRSYEPSLASMRSLLRESFAYDPSIVSDDLVAKRHAASAGPGKHDTYVAMFRDPERSGNNDSVTEDEVRSIAAPTMLLHGRDDQVIPAEASWRLLNLLDDAELHVVSRCGHWFQIEAASHFNRLVTEFFSR